MRQKDFTGLSKLILIVLTVIALFANNEVLGNVVALIWLAKGLFKLFKMAAEGGAFD